MDKKKENSSVTIFKTDSYALLILIKKSIDSRFFLYTVNTIVGSLSFDGVEGQSIFPNLNSAITYIQKNYKFEFSDVKNGIALIGLVNIGPIVFIPIITEFTTVGRILNSHYIKLIKEVDFISFELPFHSPLTPQESRRISRIKDFPLSGYHLWCDTYDLTTPLSSNKTDFSFKWNKFWTESFESIGQADSCISLLQGCVTCKIINLNSEPFRFTLISLRQNSHGGTRYYSRGLNNDGYAANEVRSELIIESNSGKVISHEWRRGTVPILWKNIFGKNIPTVSIKIEENYEILTPIYFSKLLHYYNSINIINLMHNEEGHQEKELCDSYKKSILNLDFINYNELDWHKSVKEKGISNVINILYNLIPEIEFNLSNPSKLFNIQNEPNKKDFEAGGRNSRSGSQVNLPFLFLNERDLKETGQNFENIQKKLLRINCMDSLDRTNVACFYYASYIIIKFLIEEKILPEEQINYQSIINLPIEIKIFLADSFVSSGDTISFLYTNTQACMTNVFTDIAGLEPRSISDSTIAIQRRYHNLINDKKRQKAIDLFSGRNLDKLLPNLICGNSPQLVSFYPAYFSQPLLYINNSLFDPSIILNHCPQSYELNHISHFFLQLNEYTYLDSIAFNLVPPNSPISVKISVSLTFGPSLPLVSKAALPKVDTPTLVLLKIPYDYSSNIPLCRFIHFEFELLKNSLTLSNIFVFGHRKPKPSLINNLFKPSNNLLPTIPSHQKFKDFISTLSNSDFLTIINLEISRLNQKLSRLEASSLLCEIDKNPLDFNLISSRIHKNNLFFEQNNNNILCSNCQQPLIWYCYNCNKIFCNNCNIKYKITDLYYFDNEVEICSICNELHDFIGRNLILLYEEYETFYKKIDIKESNINEWVSQNKNRLINYNLTEYPSSFFVNIDNPEMNLILTQNGGEIKSPNNLRLHLSNNLKIFTVIIEGINILGFLNNENNNEKLYFNKSGIYQWEIQSSIINLNLKNGILNKLLFKYEPILINIQQNLFNFNIKNNFKLIIFKLNNLNQKRQIILEFKKEILINGIIFHNLFGVISLILTFENFNIKKSKGYYIPKFKNDFILEFKQKELTFKLIIQFLEISNEFIEPKIDIY